MHKKISKLSFYKREEQSHEKYDISLIELRKDYVIHLGLLWSSSKYNLILNDRYTVSLIPKNVKLSM